MKYDVVVIGSGVAGYPAAISLAREGYRVAIVEENLIGGECTNYGCVPSKAYYQVAEAVKTLKKIGSETRIEWSLLVKWVKETVDSTRNSLEELMNRYGIDIVEGKGRLKTNNIVRIREKELEYRKLILALGTDPKPLPNQYFMKDRIISNREALYMDEKPESILIIGGGVIGVEFANIFSNLGIKTYIIEALQHILPFMDRDVSSTLKRYLVEKDVEIRENTSATKLVVEENSVKAILSSGETINVDKTVIAIGRNPKTNGIGLEENSIDLDKYGYILVREGYRTSNPNIYAVGDVVGGPLLAHKAILEGISASLDIMGKHSFKIDYNLVPKTIFTGLEIAWIGYTEKELRENNIRYRKARIPVSYLSAVKIKDSMFSYIKILYDREDWNKIYGIHIIAPNASEIISAYLPLYMGRLGLEEIAKTPYPHLTVSESLREVAEYILGEPIHLFLKK